MGGCDPLQLVATAATVWALQEPVDQRLFRCDYSDVAGLGKAVARGRNWRAWGFAIHAFNRALFGLAYHELRRELPVGPRKLALAIALAEHVALHPLTSLVDRYHPARAVSQAFRCYGGIPAPSPRQAGATRSSARFSAGSAKPT